MPLGDLYEMVRKGRANPFWPPVGPDRGVIHRKYGKNLPRHGGQCHGGGNLISDKR